MSKIVEDIVDDIINEINEVQIHGDHVLHLYEMRPIIEKHIAKIERPKGKWLVTVHKSLMSTWNSWEEYKCSICNTSFFYHRDICSYTSYCPKCGAKMTGERQLETKVS